MMNNTGRVLGFNFYEMWQMPHADESFALIMVKLNKEVPEMMDDTYVESIIYQLRQLGSGEVFVDYARKEVDSVRSQISKQALYFASIFLHLREKTSLFFCDFFWYFLCFFCRGRIYNFPELFFLQKIAVPSA